MTARLAIAVVGAGLIGRKHCELVAQSDACRLAAVVDPAPAARDLADSYGAPWFADLADMLATARPDGAILATPNRLHGPGAIACMSAGVPALIEKPVAESVEAARALLEAERRSGVPLLVGHHRRHNPIIRSAREIVRRGDIGELTAVNALWLLKKPDDYFDVAWRREPGGGPVLINLIHDIDNLRFICGDIVEVGAMLGRKARGFAVEDTATVTLRFAGGALGAAVVSDATPAPWTWELSSGENPIYPRRDENCYVFAGTKGSLALPRLDLWRYDGADGWWEPLSRHRVDVEPADPLVAQLRHFVDVVRGAEPPLVTCRDAAATLAVVEAVGRAAAIGASVEVEQVLLEEVAA